MGTENSLKVAEKDRGHNCNFTFAKPPVNPAAATMYNYAPDLDADMKHSIKHLSDAEDSLNHTWEIEDVQLGSDPICSSAGCE